MTEPNEPTPAAPAEPTTTAPAPTAPTAPPAPQQQPAAFDPSSLPPEARGYLKRQIAEADQKARTGSKANAAKEAREAVLAEVAQKLGITTDTQDLDPDVIIAQAKDQAWAASVELLLHRMAPGLGADPDALMDSVKFLDSVDELMDMDPRSQEFKDALEAKVKEAASRYPAKTGPRSPAPDPSQGSRGEGPTLDSRIAAARAKGDWRTAIALENQKLQQH